MDTNAEKKTLELSAIELFLLIYNKNHSDPHRLLRLQDQPDAVLEDEEGNPLGMEITHLFYDSLEAKMLMGKTDSRELPPEHLDFLIAGLNNLIHAKEEKRMYYSHDYPVSLLIRNTSLIFGLSDLLRKKSLIYKSTGFFKDIWLLSRDDSSEWFLFNLDRLHQAYQ